MSLSTYSNSDGRIHRARRSMRKLVALGLSKDEILELYHRTRDRRAQRRAAQDEPLEEDGPEQRLQQARALIRRLIALGFAEVDIADLCDLSPTTITRVLDPHEARILSAETIQTLREVVNQAGRRRLVDVLPCVRVRVLETCCDKGAAFDPVSNDQLEAGSRAALLNALLGLRSGDRVVPGVAGVLFELGEPEDGVVVMVAPCGDGADAVSRLAQLKTLEHEALHLLRSFRVEREEIERALGEASQYPLPKDGSIA